jgi:antitoxin component HigA of HigAB toxin-antitoxin module
MEKFNLFRADLVVKNNIGSDEEYSNLLSQIRKDKE